MIDLGLALVLLLAAGAGGPVVLLPLGAFVLSIALSRLNAVRGDGRACRSQYGPQKGRQMASFAVGMALALAGLATVPVGLGELGGPVQSPQALGGAAVLAAAAWLRFAFDRNDPVGATPLSPRRAAFAGLAATGGLSFAALAIDPLMIGLADFAAAMVAALLATAAGTRLAVIAVLELIDAAMPPAADTALRGQLAECGLSPEELAEVGHRRAAGRLYLDIPLLAAASPTGPALSRRAADIRQQVAARLPADTDLTIRLKL